MNRKLLPALALAAFMAWPSLEGQSSFSGEEMNSLLNNGYEMFGKERYSAAIGLFDRWLATDRSSDTWKRSEAEYHAALSSVRLTAPDAGYRMERFISSNSESPHINQARYEMGMYHYQLKNYASAIVWLEQVDRLKLTEKELPEYLFKLGYSHYLKGDQKRATMLFAEIKDVDTDYTVPATYYHACIAYENGFYRSALEGFEKLQGDDTFGGIVPFYIVQIYYLDRNYDGILNLAPGLIDQAGKEREIELYRFIGDAHFQKGNYREAIPYLEKFTADSRLSDRNDKYELAYSYYKTGDYAKASKLFPEVIGTADILTQNAYYMLGSCYLKSNDKKKAQLAFSGASKMNFDPKVKEEALFNFAKLAYENSYSPFGEGIEALHNFIETYPGSDNVTEAYNYLVSAYMRLHNYQAALSSLDKIQNRNSQLQAAYQKVAFYRGLELFRNKNYREAVTMFDKSLKYKDMDAKIRARTMYWRGEANFRLGDNAGARNDWQLFASLPGARSQNEYSLSGYNLAYTYFNEAAYTDALPLFLDYERGINSATRADIAADARNRIADCYYMSADYPTAISYYDKVIEYGKLDADYAMFQKGFAQGLNGSNDVKVSTLTSLIQKYPSSAYVPNALFERGRAYVALDQPSNGETDFNSIISRYQTSQFVPPAMVQLGLIYYNAGENEKAVAQFKKVIENYGNTPEARNAVIGLRNAYSEMDDVESYFAYMKGVGGNTDVSAATRDSMIYTSGENQYVKGNCDRSSEIFRNYLSEFPSGTFSSNARFYLAECLSRSGKPAEALDLYMQVISAGNTGFMEQSLLGAASISFGQGSFTQSYSLYEQLGREAGSPENRLYSALGMMRSAVSLEDDTKVISAAEQVLASEKLTEDLAREATFRMAKANQQLGKNDLALDDYRRVATEVATAYGAESKYHVAEILFKQGDTAGAEKEGNAFVDMKSPHAYWTGKVFLLLSDIAVTKGDTFQAKAMLQSIIDYYKVRDDGIIDEAKARLQTLSPQTPEGLPAQEVTVKS